MHLTTSIFHCFCISQTFYGHFLFWNFRSGTAGHIWKCVFLCLATRVPAKSKWSKWSKWAKGSGTGPPKCAVSLAKRHLHHWSLASRFKRLQAESSHIEIHHQDEINWNKTIYWHYTIIITNQSKAVLKDVEAWFIWFRPPSPQDSVKRLNFGHLCPVICWICSLCRTNSKQRAIQCYSWDSNIVKHCSGDSNMFQTFHLRCGVWGSFRRGTYCPQSAICCNVSMCHCLYDLPLAATAIHLLRWGEWGEWMRYIWAARL